MAHLQTKSSTNSLSPLTWVFLCSLLVLVLSTNVAFSGSIVKYLPGYSGELPFKLETGYISVADTEFFYYFIESQGDPEKDPLILWLAGGPGCSSIYGLVYEIGPIEFDIENYKGGLPRFRDYPYAWTKTASIIFLDAPVGTGFSYSRTPDGWATSDSKSPEQSYQFLRKWLLEHPKYLAVQLFIAGDSYSGMVIPVITKKVVDGNAAQIMPHLNLKGYIMGSPHTDSIIDENSKIITAHRMALISDELYEQLKISCKENYVNVDPSNAECLTALGTYIKCTKDLYDNNFLEPKCVYASPKPNEEVRRSLEDPANFILSPPRIHDLWCRNFNYVLSYTWANDVQVQDALHVRKGIVKEWQRCNLTISYTKDVKSVIDVNRYLSTKALNLLIEGGDHDMVVPFIGTEKWVKFLNLSVEDDWRPWFVDGQVAGYTRKHTENEFGLTMATLKGAGHVAPEYSRRECYELFQRWIHYYPV